MSDIIFILIVTCTILYILSTQSMQLVNLYLPSLYFTFDPGLTVTVNFVFTLREPNVYKPHGFILGFLATFICFCVTVLIYRYLYFVVNQIKLKLRSLSSSHDVDASANITNKLNLCCFELHMNSGLPLSTA